MYGDARINVGCCWEVWWVAPDVVLAFGLINSDVVYVHGRREGEQIEWNRATEVERHPQIRYDVL